MNAIQWALLVFFGGPALAIKEISGTTSWHAAKEICLSRFALRNHPACVFVLQGIICMLV